MTKLTILSATEQRRFDTPPKFSTTERQLYFSLTKDVLAFIERIRRPENKIGFVLQLGYFKSHGKFFTSQQFFQKDVEYVSKILHIFSENIDATLPFYNKKTLIDHRKQILNLLGWQPFNHVQQQKVSDHLQWLIQKQLSPKRVFLSVIDFFWQNKIELPSCYALSTLITDNYNHFEQALLNILERKLTKDHRDRLDQWTGLANKQSMQRPLITLVKQVNQSLKTSDIQENVEAFKKFRDHFYAFQHIINELNVSDQATEYFATWVQKSKAFQLSQLNNKNKLYLHLLCYIKHNFYYRHDVLIDILLKSVKAANNAANKKFQQLERENRVERNKAIKKLTRISKDSRELIEEITEIIKSPVLSELGKLLKIETSINQYHIDHDEAKKQRLMQLEQSLQESSNNQALFNTLEAFSFKLQRKISSIVKVLELNLENSCSSLVEAIGHFQECNGEITHTPSIKEEHCKVKEKTGSSSAQGNSQEKTHNPPLGFLTTNEKEEIYTPEGKFRVSLYKILLFSRMEESIKSGLLNFVYSYRYKAIHEYLIDENIWKLKKQSLLTTSGLAEFDDFSSIINKLKAQLESKYQTANKNYLTSENSYLTIDKNGKTKVSTPKIDSDDTEFIPSLLSQSGFIPILQVLSDINNITQFAASFKHSSHKHKKIKPEPRMIFAGILGKGCNIGINRIANISIGISGDTLKNTVNWCFSLKNIQRANEKVINFINKLFLANVFRHDLNQLHTGSDGRKVNVAVDSLLAGYSFKYFGKEKGVSIYTFLDERHLLFYSTVISSSEREAAYVIDGLLHNDVIKSTIHSTDTHGFTETIFAATYFIGTAFAPRIKGIGNQRIYAFSAKQTYEKRDYKILPSRTINLKLIEENWDDILRFMATIKLKHTPASQLFKRLSSYAKNHPLYKALKEFGRIIKSIFILTYFDDVELRQRIEKQLNKVELSNKFSKAVFFANNQEFKEGTKEEQELSIACKVLIQNIIVLWNYLYLSQLLANNANTEERLNMIESMKRGSLITWKHINLQGEYDFTKHAANDDFFNLEKVLALKAA